MSNEQLRAELQKKIDQTREKRAQEKKERERRGESTSNLIPGLEHFRKRQPDTSMGPKIKRTKTAQEKCDKADKDDLLKWAAIGAAAGVAMQKAARAELEKRCIDWTTPRN